MADGQITRDEAHQLGRLAGEAGMGETTVAALNERFLETLREAALADDVLTTVELRGLNRAAKALGVPSYFDDLTSTPASRAAARAQTKGRDDETRWPQVWPLWPARSLPANLPDLATN